MYNTLYTFIVVILDIFLDFQMLLIFLKCWCCYSNPDVNFFFDISTLVNTSSKVTKRLCLFQFFVVVLYSIAAHDIYSHYL